MREKFSCRDCEKISQATAPFHVLPRGFAGPGLLAMILFEKYGQHPPLNRQSERYGVSRWGRGLLFREGPGSDDNVILNATKPTQSKIVTLPCNGDGAIRAATAFVRSALGDGFEEEDIGLRLPDARELPDAIEVRIFRFSPLSRDRNLECVGRRTSLLMELSDPVAGYAGAHRRRGLFLRRRSRLRRGSGRRRSGGCAVVGAIAADTASTSTAA